MSELLGQPPGPREWAAAVGMLYMQTQALEVALMGTMSERDRAISERDEMATERDAAFTALRSITQLPDTLRAAPDDPPVPQGMIAAQALHIALETLREYLPDEETATTDTPAPAGTRAPEPE